MLHVKNISKCFNKEIGIKTISFSTSENQVVGVVGTNGAGKTTVFRLILNLIEADSGEVLWHNKPLSKFDLNDIGYLPEERGLDLDMTVEEHILYFAQLKNMTRQETLSKINGWMEELKVIGKKTDKIKNLSKGNQQKIELITTLIHCPSLIILDEPFSGLDPINSDLLKKKIVSLKNNTKNNIIFSSHNMDHVEEICDHLIMIHKGRVVLNDSLIKIKKKFGKNTLTISKNKNTTEVLSKYQHHLVEVEDFNATTLKVILKSEKIGENIFDEVISNGSIKIFNQDYPTLNDIFRKVLKENDKVLDNSKEND